MSTIVANSTTSSAVALLLSSAQSPSTNSASQNAAPSAAPDGPDDRVQISDRAKALLARAQSEQAAADKLTALLQQLTDDEPADARPGSSVSISISASSTAAAAEIFAPKVSFASRLSVGGFSISATGNADTWSSDIRIEGPNGLKISHTVFGGGKGAPTAESGGVSGLPPGTSYSSQKIGNKQYFTITSASAAAATVAAGGVVQSAVAAESTSTTIVVDFDTGGISVLQADLSTVATAEGVATGPSLAAPVAPSVDKANAAASAYTSERAKRITARAHAERSVVDQLASQVNAHRGGFAGSYGRYNTGPDVFVSAGHNAVVITGNTNDAIRTYGNAIVDAGGGNDRISTHDNSIVFGGAGADRISTYANSIVVGGDGADRINTYGNSIVLGGAGADRISTYGNSIVTGGDGADRIDTYANSIATGGAGNDRISTYDHSIVDGGDGDDHISTYDHSIARGGAGNDRISAYENAILEGGDGDDRLSAYDDANLSGGAGNDAIDAYRNAVVDAGDGDDTVRTYGFATVAAGDGNDLVMTGASSNVDGGAGNDFLQVGGGSVVSGGSGDDAIKITGENTTVNFGKGDGHDVVKAHDDVTVAITGYTRDDVVVTRGYGSTMVTFKGSDDSLLLDIDSWAGAKLTFADGSSLQVEA